MAQRKLWSIIFELHSRTHFPVQVLADVTWQRASACTFPKQILALWKIDVGRPFTRNVYRSATASLVFRSIATVL